MTVFTGRFWIVEGATHDGKIECIGVAFSEQDLTDFIMKSPLPPQYFAFRFTVGGGYMEPAAPTHETPTTSN